MTTRLSVASLELYRIGIDVSPTEDPTGDSVRFSFPVSGQPPTEWHGGSWELGQTAEPWVASILIGPDDEGSDLELAEGAYDVYVEITESPEAPRFLVDRLVVFGVTTMFATVSELADALHTDIDPEDAVANQALRDATNFIRAYTGQTITFVADDEVALDGVNRAGLLLPQVPVVQVNSVTTLDWFGNETVVDVVSYRVDRAGILWRMDGWSWCWGHANVVVNYDHGYVELPDDLHSACLQIAAHNYATVTTTVAGNVQQETIGSYSVSYGGSSSVTTSLVGGGAVPVQWKVILDHYRVPQ